NRHQRPPSHPAPAAGMAMAQRLDHPVHRRLRTTHPHHLLTTAEPIGPTGDHTWKSWADQRPRPTHPPHQDQTYPSKINPRTTGGSGLSGSVVALPGVDTWQGHHGPT